MFDSKKRINLPPQKRNVGYLFQEYALFPDMNCYALADGLPVWINLMFAIAEEVEAAYDSEQKKTDPRVRSYDQKYQRLMTKYRRK